MAFGSSFKSACRFILLNFATPIVFYVVFQMAGPKPAIGFAIGVALLQAIIQRALGLSFSPFFITATTFTVLFGTIDLFLSSPRVFRFGPFVENFVVGSIFLVTVATGRPIVLWFASALPERIRPAISDEKSVYLRNLTIIWGLYFYAKAALFLWLAFRVDLGRLIVLRSIIGSASFAVMFGGEIAYRKWIRRP